MPSTAEDISDLLGRGERSFSFEFFPPKDQAGEAVLWQAIRELESLQPTFVSVTYGAGGSSRERTIELTRRIAAETTLTPMAHLTCVGHPVEELRMILGAMADAGVRNVMALRGDPLAGPGTPWVSTTGGVEYASDLVRLVKSVGDFTVGVAAFPEGHIDAASLEADIAVLKAKYDAGAQFAVTEMVLRAGDYFGLLERAAAAGVGFPVIPGIMPILNLASMRKMVQLSGRQLPSETLARLEPHIEDPAALRAEGITIATELCVELLAGGAPGLHFYTLNRSKATREIYSRLAFTSADPA